MRLHFCHVSDSFVKVNKLSHGKNGHGERRLYISASHDIQRKLVSKKWKLDFDPNYMKDIRYFIEDPSNFAKSDPNRTSNILNKITKVQHKRVVPLKQDGDEDVRRKYIGPCKIDNNLEYWDEWRCAMIPTITTLEFHEEEGEPDIRVRISHNNNVKKYNNTPGVSAISLQCFGELEKTYGIHIQTGQNATEFALRNPATGYRWPVDGYHNCERHNCVTPCGFNNSVFEFQGTYWHRDKKEKDALKKTLYESQGYRCYHIQEQDYVDCLKRKDRYTFGI